MPDAPEGLAEDGNGHIFTDMKIPISYKNSIAQELWDAEDEATKKEVRAYRNTESVAKTVYNTEGLERLELVREYAK